MIKKSQTNREQTVAVRLPQDDQLLTSIGTRDIYQSIKTALSFVRVNAYRRTGPFYAGLPRFVHPLDSYDPDLCMLTYDLQYWKDYSRFMHACLSDQYPLGRNTVPRLSSAKSLDERAVYSFFAPFPCRRTYDPHDRLQGSMHSSHQPELDVSAVARWDRNSTYMYPTDERPIPVDSADLYFDESPQRRELFFSLIPLYRDYRKEGENTIVNRTGTPLNRNSILIVRYVLSFLESANQYRDKLTETAGVVQTNVTLRKTRKQLIEKIARIQREKQLEIDGELHSNRYSATQKLIIRKFSTLYKQTVRDIRAVAQIDSSSNSASSRYSSGGVGGGNHRRRALPGL